MCSIGIATFISSSLITFPLLMIVIRNNIAICYYASDSPVATSSWMAKPTPYAETSSAIIINIFIIFWTTIWDSKIVNKHFYSYNNIFSYLKLTNKFMQTPKLGKQVFAQIPLSWRRSLCELGPQDAILLIHIFQLEMLMVLVSRPIHFLE